MRRLKRLGLEPDVVACFERRAIVTCKVNTTTHTLSPPLSLSLSLSPSLSNSYSARLSVLLSLRLHLTCVQQLRHAAGRAGITRVGPG